MSVRDILIRIIGMRFYVKIKNLSKKILCLFKGIKKSGKNVYISPGAIIKSGHKISIGDNTVIERGTILCVDTEKSYITIGSNSYLSSYCIIKTHEGWVKIGDNCTVNNYAILYGQGGLEIGDNVRISAQVVIIPMNHIYEDPNVPICKQGIKAIGIKIEDDVWLGAGVKILDGVTIGKGSVIGAGAVVTKDIPSYSIAVGIPAEVIKKRI